MSLVWSVICWFLGKCYLGSSRFACVFLRLLDVYLGISFPTQYGWITYYSQRAMIALVHLNFIIVLNCSNALFNRQDNLRYVRLLTVWKAQCVFPKQKLFSYYIDIQIDKRSFFSWTEYYSEFSEPKSLRYDI